MFFRQVSSANQPDSSVQVKADSPVAPPVPRKLLLWLTFGVAGTVLFPIIYVIEGVTRPGYDAWQQAISALSLGPGGWIQQLNFALCGVSVLWLAYVWRKILAGGVCATWYPIIRGIEGLGLIAIAIFSQDSAGYLDVGWDPPSSLHDPGRASHDPGLVCHRPTLLETASMARLGDIFGGLLPLDDGVHDLLRSRPKHI